MSEPLLWAIAVASAALSFLAWYRLSHPPPRPGQPSEEDEPGATDQGDEEEEVDGEAGDAT